MHAALSKEMPITYFCRTDHHARPVSARAGLAYASIISLCMRIIENNGNNGLKISLTTERQYLAIWKWQKLLGACKVRGKVIDLELYIDSANKILKLKKKSLSVNTH